MVTVSKFVEPGADTTASVQNKYAPVEMTRTSSKGTVSSEEQSTSSVEKTSSGGDESISGQKQKPSSQQGSDGETKDPEAPGGVQQKWMYESLKGIEDITVEKGETTGLINKS